MHSTDFRQIEPEALAGLLIGQAIRRVRVRRSGGAGYQEYAALHQNAVCGF